MPEFAVIAPIFIDAVFWPFVFTVNEVGVKAAAANVALIFSGTELSMFGKLNVNS